MGGLAQPQAQLRSVEATLNYVLNDGQKIVVEPVGGGSTEMRTRGTLDPRQVTLRNGRLQDFTLEGDGFLLVDHDTTGHGFLRSRSDPRHLLSGNDRTDQSAERREARRCVRSYAADGRRRRSREAQRFAKSVPRVHNDYTEWSGPQRVRDLLPDEAEELLSRRFAIVQAWRPIRHPVESFPLAMCDARSISPDDLIVDRAAACEPDRPDLFDRL